MTNKEALQSILPVEVDKLIDKIFIDLQINGGEDYTIDNKDNIEIASAYCLKSIATQPEFKEGGLSIKINPVQLLKQANKIFLKHNLTDEVTTYSPKIRFTELS